MRYLIIVLSLMLFQVNPAQADTRVNIGINVSTYPALTPIPGYPVYYDPYASWNYFFYDGLYWVYVDDGWYSSSWYDGPWVFVEPVYVPVYVLRVPVRYYRRPPPYFHGWVVTAPPRWGEYWGPSWQARRRGWDHWDHRHVPHAAPLPVYQRQYSGNRYPRNVEQQHALRDKNYAYRPQDRATRQQFQQQDRLRTQPEARQSKNEPEYFRGGQGTGSNRNDDAGRQEPRNVQQGNRATAGPENLVSPENNQIQSGQDNRFYGSDRQRYNRSATSVEKGQNADAGTQIPTSQNNHFESGRGRGDRYGQQDTGPERGARNWNGGQNRGPDNSGSNNRSPGGSSNRGWYNQGGDHKQNR